MGKMDVRERKAIGREAVEILPRVIGALLDGKISAAEAADILPRLMRVVNAIKSALED